MPFLPAATLATTLMNTDAKAGSASEGHVTAEQGVRLFYRRLGAGKQAVVAPMGSWLAEPLARLVNEDRTLILYDSRGRGRSNRVEPSKISFENELSDLDAVRRHFGLQKMALMGWSFYGLMTAVYTIRHPERVTRLVQITPLAPRSDPYVEQGMQTIRSRVDGQKYQELQEKKKSGAVDREPAGYCRALLAVIRPGFFGDPADMAKMTFDECAYENEWPENQEKFWGALRSSMGPVDYRAELRKLAVPRLVIQGEKDFIPHEGSREWVADSPNAALLFIPGSGHHPFVEKPDVFFQMVDRFLAEK